MDIPLRDQQECTTGEEDAQSYMDEDDVREVRLHHWLSETASARLMQDSSLTRADSPVLGFDHHLLQTQDSEYKPLPELPASVSRLRSHSTISSTVSSTTASQSTVGVAPGAVLPHRRSSSSHSHSPAPSRRPSLARNPSLPLLSESVPVPPSPSVRQSTRLHSISSSLSLGPNRNAVYIDSEEVSSRLDEWLTTGNPELVHDDAEDLNIGEYYATNFGTNQDSPVISSTTPSYVQGPPPNTPMTAYYKTPHASSSQIYLGKSIAPGPPLEDEAHDERVPAPNTSAGPFLVNQEDVRTTPVPHGRFPSVSSSSSSSTDDSPLLSGATSSSPRTSPGVSSTSIVTSQVVPPRALISKPSVASLSMGVLSPKPSLASIGLGYQNHISSPTAPNLLSPPPVTESRWSLTSSIAGDGEKDKKKKEKGGTRKRLASFISKLSGSGTNKEIKDGSESPTAQQEEIRTRQRSHTDASLRESVLLPPVQIKSRSKPPSLKLGPLTNAQSVANLRSPTLTLSSRPSLTSLTAPLSPTKSSVKSMTPTPTTFSPSVVTSPVSTQYTPVSPINSSFASARLSVSTSMTTTSTNTASPLMPTTPVLTDAQPTSPTLKNAVSVPVLSPAWEGPGFLRRGSSFGWSVNSSCYESAPVSPTNAYDDDDDDLEDDAEYYTREFSMTCSRDPLEEERKARLSVITDMLDRDLKAPTRQESKVEAPVERSGLFYKPKGTVRIEQTEGPSHSNRASPTHFRKSSSASRTSSPIQRRSVSGPSPISPTISTPPPVPSKNSFKTLAARMRISNSTSTPHAPINQVDKDTDSKRKSIANLMSNNKRKGPKRRLVISGVGDGQGEVDALREWCASLGEVRSMVKAKSVEGEIAQTGQGEGHNVWVVDFKKSSVAESVCRLQAKVEIKGAGSVRLSWETPKPKIRFGMGRTGWIP